VYGLKNSIKSIGYGNSCGINLNKINSLSSRLPGLPFFYLVPLYDVDDRDNNLKRMRKMQARAPLFNGQAGRLSGKTVALN
jgi:hypothetical protein